MPVMTVKYYICSRCRVREEEEPEKVKLGYGAYGPGAPTGWTQMYQGAPDTGLNSSAYKDLCKKCSEELKKWLAPREDREL